jgi:hypothetical protein
MRRNVGGGNNSINRELSEAARAGTEPRRPGLPSLQQTYDANTRKSSARASAFPILWQLAGIEKFKVVLGKYPCLVGGSSTSVTTNPHY